MTNEEAVRLAGIDPRPYKVLVFALIVVFLQFRPAGLFPQKGRMVEA